VLSIFESWLPGKIDKDNRDVNLKIFTIFSAFASWQFGFIDKKLLQQVVARLQKTEKIIRLTSSQISHDSLLE